ncbi:hypothetical protein MY10362_008577 [Beauveria mimosiformis]
MTRTAPNLAGGSPYDAIVLWSTPERMSIIDPFTAATAAKAMDALPYLHTCIPINMNAAPDSFSNGSAAGKGDDATDGTRDPPFVGSSRADGGSVPVSTSLDRDQGKPDDPCQDSPASPVNPFDDIFAVFDA